MLGTKALVVLYLIARSRISSPLTGEDSPREILFHGVKVRVDLGGPPQGHTTNMEK